MSALHSQSLSALLRLQEQRRKEKVLSVKPVSSERSESSVMESSPNVFEFSQTEAALQEAGPVETGSADQLVDSEKLSVPEAVVSADAGVDKRKKAVSKVSGGPGQKGLQNRSNRLDRSGPGGGRGDKVPAAAVGEQLPLQAKAGASSFSKGAKVAPSKFAPNKKLFEDAVHQTAGVADGRKDRQKGAPSAAVVELTNEEKFNRAQQSFQAKGTFAVQASRNM